MRQPIKFLFFSIVFLTTIIGYAQDQCQVVGWATQNGGVTGGGTATPTVVTTYADLKTALTTTSVKVVYVSGVITFPTNGRLEIKSTNGKTIIGLAGSRLISVDKTASGSGILYVKNSTNLILRNLTFEGPGAYDVDGNDNLTFDNVQNAWIDHCDFQDGMDGNFDIKNMSSYISITWCKFEYLKPPIAGGSGGTDDHRFSDLLGSSDSDTQDDGNLFITFQYCWWAQGCVERMPRVRFGKVHIANCYYNSTVSNTCIRAGYKANLLIESNVFNGVTKPIDLYNNDFTAVTAQNNIFTATTGGTTGSGTAFTPPYTLTIAAASTVQSLVTNTACGSGATLDSPTQCGCGTVANQNPTATLTAPSTGSTACVGTAITISATALDSDGTISQVDFYNGTTLLGTDASSPYSITYIPTAAATLSIKATATDNAGGTGTSGTLSITVNALPTATITSPATSFCTGGSVVLTASSGSSYKWFNGTTQVGTASTYTATAAGAYTVEVTNATGCKATSAVTQITVNTLPTATISSSTTNLCTSGSIVLTASSGSSYKWFNGATQVGTASTYTAIAAGDYTVEVTNASGCKATSAARTLTGTPQATPTITSPSTSICAGGSVILTASTGSSYVWKNGTTQVGTSSTYTATATGAYTVEVTNATGCKATSAVTQITVNAAPTSTINAPATSFCAGGSVILTASTGSSYVWKNGTTQVGTSSTYTATATGAYTVEVTNASGCKATSAVTQITVNAAPTSTITAPATSFCTGGSVVLTASSGSSYKWFNGTTQVGTASTYTATAAGTYTVEVTNAAGCKATSAVTQISVNNSPTATITTSSTSICDGSSVILTASAGSSYKWFNGSTQVGTDVTYTATSAGAYTVEVTNNGGCKGTSAVTQIGIIAAPTATITASANSFCTGKSAVLTASSGSSYKWFNGLTQIGNDATYTVTSAGAYTVEVTNANNCKATSAVAQITVTTIPAPTITSPSTSICSGGTVILSSSIAASYKWFNGTTQVGTSSAYTVRDAGAYTVEITDANGCKATSAVTQIAIGTTETWYADTDNDGVGDISNTLSACAQPTGYVSTSGDECPADANKTAAGNCGCNHVETSSCLTTATINGSNSNIKVVPQPFDVNTSITLENYGMIQSITIISSSGTIVETKQNINAESVLLGESLASGLYTVLIQSEKGMYTTKLVKK
jgi:pectate lyase